MHVERLDPENQKVRSTFRCSESSMLLTYFASDWRFQRVRRHVLSLREATD